MGDPVTLWAEECGIESEHMTLNILQSSAQYGRTYAAMCTLFLPSLWNTADADRLQTGLARALSRSFDLSDDQVHVITRIVGSGHVVEADEIVTWSTSR
ncbi:MAG: hypothetical protein AAF402_09245 [Pseudomonadota bacterium]